MLSILPARAGPQTAYRLAPALTLVVTGSFCCVVYGFCCHTTAVYLVWRAVDDLMMLLLSLHHNTINGGAHNRWSAGAHTRPLPPAGDTEPRWSSRPQMSYVCFGGDAWERCDCIIY